MKFNYSSDLFPPGLILPAFARSLDAADIIAGEAKIDTGADLTVIPEHMRLKLKLKPCGRTFCRGAFDRQAQEVPTYFIELSLDRKNFIQLEVLSVPRKALLLGRDVLNGFVLLANGPKEFFEIDL